MRLKLVTALLALSTTLSVGSVSNDSSNEVNLVNSSKQDLYVEISDEVFQEANKSVVTIIIYAAQGSYSGLGSGVIINEDENYYYILTNNHVVAEGSYFEAVSYKYERQAVTVLGTNSTQDCAVVRIKKYLDAKVATLGDSDYAVVGEEVFAIGTPASLTYKNSITKGIISGVNRCATTSTNVLLEAQKHAIAIDLAVNPGNSGGALFNAKGELIGINTLKLTSDSSGSTKYEAINLALPINDMLKGAKAIMNSVVVNAKGSVTTKGEYIKSSLGKAYFYSITDMSLKERKSLSIPLNIYQGVYVRNIVQEATNPLFTDDFGEGTIIVSIDGKKVFDKVMLRQYIYDHEVGDQVVLDVYKKINGEYTLQSVKMTLIGSQD